MRFFYAIEFDEKTRELLVKEQNRMKSGAIKANFTRTENLHLTLRFMGEIDPVYFPVLKKISSFVAARNNAFTVTLSEPGAFVRGHKSILWWGVKDHTELIALQKNLEEEIRLNGFPAETKPYTPHITVAREFVAKESVEKLIAGLKPLGHTFRVNGISLMESTRIHGKLTYLCRHRSLLLKEER